eukprot:719023-Rhodomonas_salina.1
MVVDNAQASSKGETAMSKDDSETPVDQPWEKFGGSEEGSTDGDLMCSVCLEMLWDPIVLPFLSETRSNNPRITMVYIVKAPHRSLRVPICSAFSIQMRASLLPLLHPADQPKISGR